MELKKTLVVIAAIVLTALVSAALLDIGYKLGQASILMTMQCKDK